MADLPAHFATPIAIVAIVSIAVVVVTVSIGLILWGIQIIGLGWGWILERVPSERRTAEASAAEAARLGLRYLGRDATSLDLTFPFLQTGRLSIASFISTSRRFLAIAAIVLWLLFAYLSAGQSPPEELGMTILVIAAAGVLAAGVTSFLLDTRKWLRDLHDQRARPMRFNAEAIRPSAPGFIAGLVRGPRVERIFAGAWADLDVRVFDYSYAVGDERDEWTCALLPLGFVSPGIEITRESLASRLKGALGLKDLTLGHEEFDRAFRILADDDTAARRLLDARVRSRLLADAVPRFVIQIQGRRILYCRRRLPMAQRGALLEVAKRFRDLLPVS
jgi:hypothetical protein